MNSSVAVFSPAGFGKTTLLSYVHWLCTCRADLVRREYEADASCAYFARPVDEPDLPPFLSLYLDAEILYRAFLSSPLSTGVVGSSSSTSRESSERTEAGNVDEASTSHPHPFELPVDWEPFLLKVALSSFLRMRHCQIKNLSCNNVEKQGEEKEEEVQIAAVTQWLITRLRTSSLILLVDSFEAVPATARERFMGFLLALMHLPSPCQPSAMGVGKVSGHGANVFRVILASRSVALLNLPKPNDVVYLYLTPRLDKLKHKATLVQRVASSFPTSSADPNLLTKLQPTSLSPIQTHLIETVTDAWMAAALSALSARMGARLPVKYYALYVSFVSAVS